MLRLLLTVPWQASPMTMVMSCAGLLLVSQV
ncbi:MAG: hypothetical protein QG639_881, partial [Patescibacteria group bacterium]|nr:hypothetical protein [Patescibacteria group bacterium]